MIISQYVNKHISEVKIVIFIACLVPVANLLLKYYQNNLGINPFETIMRTTGYWAMFLLVLTLAVTPLRRILAQVMRNIHAIWGKRLSDYNWLIKIRRMLGVYSFFYACLHFYCYIALDQGFDFEEMSYDIQERPFIMAGLLAFILFIPMAITSTNGMMRLLKQNWRRIHRLIYPLSIVVIVHFIWQTKVGVYDPYFYAFIVFSLLFYRFIAAYGLVIKRSFDDGMEVAERPPYNPNAKKETAAIDK